MEVLGIFSAFGLSASAGLNAYLPLLAVALLARFTNLLKLSPPYDALTSWWAIGVLVFLSMIEFFADKFPAVNHVNDIIQTFVRPAAGAILFAASAQVVTDLNPVLSIIAGIIVAGSVHAVKSVAVRPTVTAATAGVGNVPVSIAEDIVSAGVSVLSVAIPALAAILLTIIVSWIVFSSLKRHQSRQQQV